MIKNKYLTRIVLFGAILVAFTACDNSIIFNEEQDISNPWHYDQAKSFTFDIQDTTSRYKLMLDIHHDEDFKYQNLYTQIKMTYPDGTELNDIVSLELSSKPGLWDASCSGGDCNLEVLLQKKAYFPKVGPYKLIISQYSRDSLLSGISKLGFRVKRLEK